jgi:tetratricopeptide (TPR) repeat protein
LLLGAGLPDNIRNLIMERSEGNPYFIEEFVRMMIDRGYLQNRDGSWIITSAEDLASLAIPSSLETLIRSRIDALPVELKEVTESAAVIGPLFEMELLRSVCEAPDIEGSLRRLESRQLVMRTEKPDQWQFNHSLIETVVYGAMLKAKRKELHQKIAYALESRWAGAEAEHAGELAYRFLQAEEGAKALIYLLTAGEQAASKFANEEAISYFEQAAEQLSHQPDTDDSLRWRLAAGLGDTYRALGRYEDSKSALETGVILAEGAGLSTDLRAGLNRRLGETALKRGDLEDARQYFTIALNFLGEIKDNRGRAETARSLNGLAWTYFMQGQPDLAKRTVEEGMGHARKASALSELAAAENLLGGIFYRQNDWKSAAHHTTRAMVLREQMGYTWGVASTLNNLGILSVSAGEWSKAASFFERSLALRKELGDVEGVALAHNNVGTLARDQGKLDRAEAHFRSSLDIATMFKMGFHIANTKIGLAQVLLLKGELTSAQELLSATMDQAISVGAKDLLAEIHRVKAEILLEEAALDQAWAEAQQSIALAEEASDRSLQATAWRVMSVVHLARGEVTAAREAADGARELLGRVSDNLEIARIAAQAGLVYLAEGEPVLAQAELQVARETFMRLGASLCLEQVDQALKQASLAG